MPASQCWKIVSTGSSRQQCEAASRMMKDVNQKPKTL